MFYVADDFKSTTLFEDNIIEYTAKSHSTTVLNLMDKSINKEFDANPTISADCSAPSCQQIHLETVNNNSLFTSACQPKINLQKLFLQNKSSIQVTENDSTKIIDTNFISPLPLKCIQTVPIVNNQSNCLTDASKFEKTIKNIQKNNYTNCIDSADALISNTKSTILKTSLDKDFGMKLETKLIDRPLTILNDDVQSCIGQLETQNAANILLDISSKLSNQQRNQMANIDSTKPVEIAISKPLSETVQITQTDDTQSTYSSAAEYGCNQTQIGSHESTSMITNNAPVVLNSFISNSKNHSLNGSGLLYKTVKVLHDTYGFVVLPNNIWQSVHFKDFNITMFFDNNTLGNKVSFNNSLVPLIHINNKSYEYSKAIQSKHELEYLLKDISRNKVCLGINRIVYNKCISYTNNKLCHNCKSTINYEN